MSENTETAILAGGCFWPAQQLLRHRDGVISTRVGYAGGETDNPTADNHPGHAEAVEVIFDPGRTSYRDILEFFFQIHRPDLGAELVGSGYSSEIFHTSDEQRQVAEDTIADADASGIWHGKVVTKISQAGPFWEAEAYDQDYLKYYPLRQESVPSVAVRCGIARFGQESPGSSPDALDLPCQLRSCSSLVFLDRRETLASGRRV
jgi:peptide-methionine (S)-S-oxide reductase